MANKSQRGKSLKKKVSKSKEETKDRKKKEKTYGDSIKSARGQKRILNKKRHRGKHTKGTRKGD